MKKSLTKREYKVYYYKNGIKKEGVHKGISGNVSGIRGDVSDIRGDVSGIYGNVSGIYGYVSGIYGNIDECEITDEEREKGIDIKDLIK